MPHSKYLSSGVIGNRFSSAIINSQGSIDWCCLPYLDSPSHFGAWIDKNRGGYFQIMPHGDFRSNQKYLQKSNILQTQFETPQGKGLITDWMPISNERINDSALCRQVEVTEGNVEWILTCMPRFRYGTEPAQAERHRHGVLFRGGQTDDLASLYSRVPFEISASGSSAISRFKLNKGEKARFTWIWGRNENLYDSTQNPTHCSSLKSTQDYWNKVSHHCPTSGCVFAGPWHEAIVRSQLILKILIAPYSGSISQATSVSLQGFSPGSQTWGHRYASIRNSALHLQALAHLGCEAEAKFHFEWIREIVERDGAESLQSTYTLDGGKIMHEKETPYLNQNESSRQFQLDIYGHVVVAAWEYFNLFKEFPEDFWPKLSDIIDYVCHAWKRPDHGPWGFVQRPEHFVVSKLFCWAALDKGCQLAKDLGLNPPPRWLDEKEILHQVICDQGFDPARNSFVRSFGNSEIDASCLWIPLLGFLSTEDLRVQGTLSTILTELSHGVLLRRTQRPEENGRNELSDLWSTFLYISCLALSDRVQEASDRLAEVCTYANSLGLLTDTISHRGAEGFREFPSASVHLALIHAALNVGWARERAATPRPLRRAEPSSRAVRVAKYRS